jgi:DNA-binding MarR family transcriptional regulator
MDDFEKAVKFSLRFVKRVKIYDILDRTNSKKNITHARKLVIRYLRERCDWSFNQIANKLGYADHTSVKYLYDTSDHEWLLATYRYDDNVR